MDAKELLDRYTRGHRNFTGINLSEAQLIGLDLSDIILRSALLNVANFSSANLSGADLHQAQLNVSRLTGANLSRANLRECKLNVANLIRTVLVNANLSEASLIRAEMLRANLSGAQLIATDLSEADLREAKLRQANLHKAMLNRADLRDSNLVGAQLEQASLNHINADRADLQGANLTDAELRHGLLNQANLSGAILKGANLRWADLSGANLSNADLTDAKLSGAKLIGTNLAGANLANTVLVHADLSNANLMDASWVDSDASGAVLTGIKLHGTVRYNLVLNDAACQWVDLSPNGDRSQIQKFTSTRDLSPFFCRSPAQVQLVLDGQLTPSQLRYIGEATCRLAASNPLFNRPPSIDIAFRQTTLTYSTKSDLSLVALSYGALAYFHNGPAIQKQIIELMKLLQKHLTGIPVSEKMAAKVTQLLKELQHVKQQTAVQVAPPASPLTLLEGYGQKVLQLELINSSNQRLQLYQLLPNNPIKDSPTDLQSAHPDLDLQLPGLLKFIQRCSSY
jgi:uncharacterized protein YjbI with pentapeptide repeats